MKRKITAAFITISLMALFLGACGRAETGEADTKIDEDTQVASEINESRVRDEVSEVTETASVGSGNDKTGEEAGDSEIKTEEDTEKMLQMRINGTAVNVLWEENESVEALMELCKDSPLEIQMSMYGGFEQVGPLGTDLPRNDMQTTTQAGDIVLYSGNQIVVFYGSNSWSYTRLGHITDQDNEGMAELLSNGDVTVTISMEAQQ